MSAPDPLRIGQSPLTPGVPAPGVWVVEIHGYDQESGELDTHSVSIHATRAQAVTWVESILEDVRSEYDEDFGWRPEITEDHQQPTRTGVRVLGCPPEELPVYEDYVSTWIVTVDTHIEGGPPVTEQDPYLTLTVRQARFGYAYTAF